ncbi:hypothetical protein M2132_000862 [Dysgonomonas sp. PH5-45]|uniref:hypothetical protein n=1 Tax=unclassified Dysgonomonas TaxID=2630389 RepID=UPI0024770379|nr:MULTISPECIES: hypothetical protein [unclassified Dysgonomonas]MDH6354534.1 hypothetical protein [Dysgonomonas sp. PH5-45]MDH6387410.1 hypothetical protein [Dysgonomonas sp. PH5-37]
MAQKSTDTLSVSYPDLGFAFNPITLRFTYTPDIQPETEIRVLANGIELVRETRDQEVTFDLSAVARSLFDRDRFHHIPFFDNVLCKTLSVSITSTTTTDEEEAEINIAIPVIWGALQIGETYSQSKTLTMFRGYPFTVPYYEGRTTRFSYTLQYGGQRYLVTVNNNSKGSTPKYNLPLPDDLDESIHKVEYIMGGQNVQVGPFDYTFDDSFLVYEKQAGGNDLLMTVNIETPCYNDGFYLRWINRWGEWNYYLFRKKGESTQVADSSIVFDPYFDTIDFTDGYHVGTGKTVGKTAQKTIQLYASLVDADTYDFLSQIAQSPVVDLFMGYAEQEVDGQPQTIARWASVRTQAATFAKGKDHLQDFELNMLIPQTQTLNL